MMDEIIKYMMIGLPSLILFDTVIMITGGSNKKKEKDDDPPGFYSMHM